MIKRWPFRKKSLQIGLVARYTVFFIVSMLAVLVTLFLYLGYFLASMTDEDIGLVANAIHFSGTLTSGDLVVINEPESVLWIDYLKEGTVVHSTGDRMIERQDFSTEEINKILSSVFYAPRMLDYNVRVLLYPYDGSQVEVALVYTSINEEFSLGMNVPEEFRGTEIERQIQERARWVYGWILMSLAVVIGFFSLLTFRMIVKPIRALNAGLLAVKHGELSTRISYEGYRELMELTESFNEMTHRLEVAEKEAALSAESKKSMILNLSHDLRTPATVVHGYAKALVEGKVPEEKRLRYYQHLLDKSGVIVSRIEQLFAYAKLDVSRYDLSLEKVDLCEFVRLLVIGYLEEMESHGHQLDIDLPETSVWCEIDVVEMSRALGNLIENAIKYSGEGSRISIGLFVREDGKQCGVVIEDNGRGLLVSGADVARLFDPFVCGDGSRQSGGTGLGLAITRQIVRLHGGDVVCEPLEKGVRFTVTL